MFSNFAFLGWDTLWSTNITMEKSSVLIGKSTISMAILNSYRLGPLMLKDLSLLTQPSLRHLTR